MQTIYFETTHSIQHTGNVVDLTEYREKLALARGEELEIPACVRMDEAEAAPVPPPRRRTRRSGRRPAALAADWAASAAIVAMAVAMIVKIL